MSKKKKIPKEEQLDLDIKEPLKNKFFKVKGRVDLAILQFEIKKFLKDPLLWAMIIIGMIFIAQQILLIYKDIDTLPKYLPVFKYFLSAQDKLALKEYIYIYPLISIVVFLVSLISTSKNYNRERNFTKLLMASTLLCIISQSIILVDLMALS